MLLVLNYKSIIGKLNFPDTNLCVIRRMEIPIIWSINPFLYSHRCNNQGKATDTFSEHVYYKLQDNCHTPNSALINEPCLGYTFRGPWCTFIFLYFSLSSAHLFNATFFKILYIVQLGTVIFYWHCVSLCHKIATLFWNVILSRIGLSLDYFQLFFIRDRYSPFIFLKDLII